MGYSGPCVYRKDEYVVALSSRGAPQLVCNGFRYGLSKNNKHHPHRYWRCTARSTTTVSKHKCGAAGRLIDDGSFILTGVHSHPSRDWS